jgi:prophage antirepressor-like protein
MTSSNTPTLFDFKGHDLRVVTLDGTPWFVASDVCKALGMGRPAQAMALSMFNAIELRDHRISGGQYGRPNKLVTEAGLYTLVMRSDKPEAKAFQAWVTGTVLPAIRKDGGYIKGEEKVVTGEMSEDELVLKAMDVMRRKIDRLAAERDAMHKELFHVTVAEYAALNHVYFSPAQKVKLSVLARKLTIQAGGEVIKSPRVVSVKGKLIDTSVNVYPRDALDRAAKDLGLFAAVRGEQRPLMAA